MKIVRSCLIVVVGLGCVAFAACKSRATSPLTVAAAADLKFALDEFLEEYRRDHPEVDVRVSYGSSGNFHAQIRHGAPFDLYLSADVDYPRRLAEAGFAQDEEVFLYGAGRIVVWVPATSPIDVETLGIAALADPAVKKIAIANPRHAPYGRAAVAALESFGVYERVAPKLIYGESVAQAAQFVDGGAADIGIIALSLAIAPPMADEGRYWEIPPDAYPTLEQGGMIVAKSKNLAAAQGLRDRLLGARGRSLLERYGFSLPSE